MKKILSLLFIFVAFGLPSLAVITPEEATSQTYIQNHGHSSEMAQLIDMQHAGINGVKNTTYKSTDPGWYTSNIAVNLVRKAFMYFDCVLDDHQFFKHDIKYAPNYQDL